MSVQKSDLYLRKEHPYLDNEKIALSSVLGYEYTMLSHVYAMSDNTVNGSLFNKFILWNFLITVAILAANLLLLICLLGLWRCSRFSLIKSLKKCFAIFFHLNMAMQLKLGARTIFLLFLTVLLVRFFEVMISNSMQLIQIIVDSSKILKTDEDVLQTQRRICWLAGEKDRELFENSEKTFIRRVWQTKNLYRMTRDRRRELCIVSTDSMEQVRFSKTFFFTKKFVVFLFATFIPKLFNFNFWVNPRPFFQYYTAYYVRKNQSKNKLDFINKVTQQYFESDLIDVERILGPRLFNIDRTMVAFDLKSFVDQNLKFERLTLERLRSIFVYYLGLSLLWALLFGLHKFRVKMKMFFKRLKISNELTAN